LLFRALARKGEIIPTWPLGMAKLTNAEGGYNFTKGKEKLCLGDKWEKQGERALRKIIEAILQDSLSVKDDFIKKNTEKLILLAERVAQAFANDKKLMICGNGGSAADAQHIAAEFVNRYEMERPSLPAIALTTDTSILTSIGNDYSFEEVFSKQIKAMGLEGDVLLAISTSGNSNNVVKAVRDAKDLHIYTAAFLGQDGGMLAKIADLSLIARSKSTPRVQEAHILAGHILCHLVEYILFQRHLGHKGY